MEDLIKKFAKQTFLAYKNPYRSVEKIYPQAIDKVDQFPFYYLGLKNRPEIPTKLIHSLEKSGHYALHTLDTYSFGGRAIDPLLTNPITGRPMTGSSSGTAINVLLGINDIGIGTDGGGSVLAPAIALHLFSFISPSIAKEHLKQFTKESTDGHPFTPSIGFMSRNLRSLKKIVETVLMNDISPMKSALNILVINGEDITLSINHNENIAITYLEENLNAPRIELIERLTKWIDTYDLIISKEGPIDLDGLGDTVMGHLGPNAKAIQESGNKGLIRVANMVDAAAMTVPTDSLATGYVLISRDTTDSVNNMFTVAARLSIEPDRLLNNYFASFENYFGEEFEKI